MKLFRWFWGLFFLVAAGILVASQMGMIAAHLSVWTIILTIFLVAIILNSIRYLNFFGITFPLAFIGILYARQLGIYDLVPWTILGAALLLSIGLSIIFHPIRRRSRHGWHPNYSYHRYHDNYAHHTDSQETPIVEHSDEDNVFVEARMSNSIRYVTAKHLSEVQITASMAGVKVYFDDAQLSDEGAVITVDASLSGVELFIPRTWNVILQVDPTLGGVDERGTREVHDGPAVYLRGSTRLSGLKIIYN